MQRALLSAFLLASALALPRVATAAENDRIVIVAGGPSHGFGEHEYRAGALLVRDALEAAQDRFRVEVSKGWPDDPRAFDHAAAVVLTMDGDRWHLANEHLEELDALAERGVGLLALHWAVHATPGQVGDRFLRWFGGFYETGVSSNPKWDAALTLDRSHPISRGVPDVTIHDEWYIGLRFADAARAVVSAIPNDADRQRVSHPLPWARAPRAVREASGVRETLVWTIEREDGGRGAGITGGHYHWNFANDAFRTLVLNAIVWVAGGAVPEAGVASKTPSGEQLMSPQDERRPFCFDECDATRRFGVAFEDGRCELAAGRE